MNFTSLQSIKVLQSAERNSSIDFFRALAIIGVVVYHFNGLLPFGYIGVDLFFVISGFLIGSMLIKSVKQGNAISFFKFFTQRAFKIWPSYYAFLLIGSVAAWLMYHNTHQELIIPSDQYLRYIFFYVNYTSNEVWSFAHLWSLCVEEHFYILLPLLLIIIQKFVPYQWLLTASVILVIISGILFKIWVLYYTHSKDTYSATHNRIDALAWGVLLSIIKLYYPDTLQNKIFQKAGVFSGIVILVGACIYFHHGASVFFQKSMFHSVVPFSFFLLMGGAYYWNFSFLTPLRIIAYYSYNWYLWHPLLVVFIAQKFGKGNDALLLFVLITFILAVIFTVLVEEPFLRWRNKLVAKWFGSDQKMVKPVG
jgi:peptidoglycan/LPS O-acetylase OafA/YrhL